MIRKILFLVLLVALCSLSILAQQKRFKVGVVVDGDDALRTDTESYLKRELRSLGDVDVVTELPDYSVSVHVMALEKNNVQRGIVVAYQFFNVVTCQTKLYYAWIGGGLMTTNERDTRQNATKIITSFDTEILEQNRVGK